MEGADTSTGSAGSGGAAARPTPGRPFLSVIVIAHGRRTYLLGAVRSALEQELPRTDYEVLVVKDYADPALDSELDRWGVLRCETVERPLGAKVALGMGLARGEVLCCLEDDDLFAPTRLRYVAEQFRARPDLGYLRNGQWRIDESGRRLPAPALGRAHRNLAAIGVLTVAPEELPRAVGRLGRVDPDFNLSSIAVRRSVIAPRREELRALPAAVDSFLFYAALGARATVQITSAPLTGYRVHGANASLWQDTGPEGVARRVEYQRTFLASFAPIHERLAREGPPAAAHLAGSALYGTRVLYGLLTGEGGRSGMRRNLRAFWRESPWAVLRFRRDLTVWGLAALVAPRSARAAWLRRRRAELTALEREER
jgi:Glycosyl transferase family 2